MKLIFEWVALKHLYHIHGRPDLNSSISVSKLKAKGNHNKCFDEIEMKHPYLTVELHECMSVIGQPKNEYRLFPPTTHPHTHTRGLPGTIFVSEPRVGACWHAQDELLDKNAGKIYSKGACQDRRARLHSVSALPKHPQTIKYVFHY